MDRVCLSLVADLCSTVAEGLCLLREGFCASVGIYKAL